MHHAGLMQTCQRGQQLSYVMFTFGCVERACGQPIFQCRGTVIRVGRICLARKIVGQVHHVEEMLGCFAYVMDCQ